ncbi:MAG: hypothetical protein KKE17_15610 [Proteobacteria bacterium]|nr:hypothetical protein [Pseudomonadota bacterium]
MWFAVRPLQRAVEVLQTYVTALQAVQPDAVVKTHKISIATVPDGSEEDSGFDLPVKGVVLDVFVDVTTAEVTGTTKLLDVGLDSGEAGGDANGFLTGIDCASLGLQKGTLLNSGQTLGALLAVDEGGTGELVPEPHVLNGTAVSVTYTASAADWAEFVGDIYVVYIEM